MPAKILFTSPSPELTALCRDVAATQQVDLEIVEGVFDEAAALARRSVARNRDLQVIISRDATARAVQKAVGLPVVLLEPTDSDYLQALSQAQHHSQRVGLLAYRQEEHTLDLGWFAERLGITVDVFSYADQDEFRGQIERAALAGIRVMVMRSYKGRRLAAEAGMVGITVHTSRRAVVQAMERALTVIRARQQEWERTHLLQAILNHVDDGVVATDSTGRVTHCNPVAERILGVRTGAFVVGDSPVLTQLFADYQPRLGYLLELGGTRILANRAPVDPGDPAAGTVVTFQDVTKIQLAEQHIRKELYSQGLVSKYTLGDIVAGCQPMQVCLAKARQFGPIDATVMIFGESGTGKELFAQGIHDAHPRRRSGPFVAVNCAALPQSLLESELFGYEGGAFTGARKGGKPGLFELAHGGTIFLDEIGKMSLELQARLLRVLQERQVMRLGGDRVVPVDVRVIAATNENLTEAIAGGRFRPDLYYRLNLLRLTIPPLRERREDIPLLVDFFLARAGEKYGTAPCRPSPRLMNWLLHHHWPGNVRQLENVVESYVVLGAARDEGAFLAELEAEARESAASFSGDRLVVDLGNLAAMEQQILEQAVRRLGGNRAALARVLGISRSTLWKKLKQVGACGEQAEGMTFS